MTDYNLQISMGGGPVENGVYNVLSYGAKGDAPTTDDTTAVQATIDACVAAGGGEIYFPPGLYKIVGGLSVDYDGTDVEQLDFRGAGKHTSRLLLYASGTENLLEIDCWETASRSTAAGTRGTGR